MRLTEGGASAQAMNEELITERTNLLNRCMQAFLMKTLEDLPHQ